MATTMNEKTMNAAAKKLGLKVFTQQCSGYMRLIAVRGDLRSYAGLSPSTMGVKAVVETTDCTLGEARAKLIAAVSA